MAPLPDMKTAAADEIRLAELAAAKLKRQQQRISENDATLDVVKPKTGRKPKTEWKPFSFANSSEDAISVADSIDSRQSTHNDFRLPTPFDVHAKPFTPVIGERNGRSLSSTRQETDPPTSRLPSLPVDEDDGPEFQLVTGKKAKPSSKPALHLNAYEAKTSDKAPTMTASFNKKEINDVFGNDLPPPEFVQANPGCKHGQLQFVMHPNGDVAAQSWSNEEFQWTCIGQYSYARRRREGTLAASRLRGETEQHTLLQNTLAYFRAVAKQHEALAMGLPWGLKEIEQFLPTPRVVNSPPTQKVDEPKAAPVAAASTTTTITPSYTVASKFPLRPSSNTFEPRAIATFTRDDTQSSLNSMSFGSFPASSLQPGNQRNFGTGETAKIGWGNTGMIKQPLASTTDSTMYSSWHSMPTQSANGVHQRPLVWSTDTSFLEKDGQPDNGTKTVGHQGTLGHKTVERDIAKAAPSVPPGLGRATPIYPPGIEPKQAGYPVFTEQKQLRPATKTEPFPPFDNNLASDRSAMKNYLNKLGETASARGMSTATAARTVLHDPMRNQKSTPAQASPFKAISPLATPSRRTDVSTQGMPTWEHVYQTWDPTSTPARNPAQAVDAREARRLLLGVSEPDPDTWNTRSAPVVDVQATGALSHEQLAVYSKPTPQNWNGPFFTGSAPAPVNQKSYDEELHDWFTGGNRKARQDDLYERIKAAHYATTPRKSSPGAVGTPKGKARDEGPGEFNETTTRLLIPVLENLSSYVEGPIEKRHGPFARYAPPPEWCIDKSPKGNQSFFGDDWGQPPERIGRDSRYRPMAYEGRFGGFQTQPTQPAIGTLTGLSKSVRPLDGRFKFGGANGGGRKW